MSNDTIKVKPPKKKITRLMTDNLYAVASGKGGVGKTWFSITLSHALAKAGKKVLLFDGDLGLANVDVQLGLMVKHDINDVIEGKLGMDRVIHHYEDGGFDVVAGRSGQSSLSSLPLSRLNAILKEIRKVADQYDIVLMDLGAGVDLTVRFLSSAAAKTLLVTTDEPTALTDAYAFLKLSNSAGHADTVELVINNISSIKEGGRTYNTLSKASQNFLNLTPPLLGMIRHDPKVRESIRNQIPILTRSPNCNAAEDIGKIAEEVIQNILMRAK